MNEYEREKNYSFVTKLKENLLFMLMIYSFRCVSMGVVFSFFFTRYVCVCVCGGAVCSSYALFICCCIQDECTAHTIDVFESN